MEKVINGDGFAEDEQVLISAFEGRDVTGDEIARWADEIEDQEVNRLVAEKFSPGVMRPDWLVAQVRHRVKVAIMNTRDAIHFDPSMNDRIRTLLGACLDRCAALANRMNVPAMSDEFANLQNAMQRAILEDAKNRTHRPSAEDQIKAHQADFYHRRILPWTGNETDALLVILRERGADEIVEVREHEVVMDDKPDIDRYGLRTVLRQPWYDIAKWEAQFPTCEQIENARLQADRQRS